MSQITNNLNSVSSTISINILGTDGTGYINLPPQITEPTAPSQGYQIYSDSDSNLSWKNQSGNVFKLDTAASSTSHTWILPNSDGEILTTVTIGDNIPDGSSTTKGSLIGITNDFTASVGKNTLGNITSGVSNVAMGVDAGTVITTGSRNTILGSNANVDLSSGNDRIAIGYNASATTDGQLSIAPAITEIKITGLTAAIDGTGTILSFDTNGIIKPSAGTYKSVSLIDTKFGAVDTALGLRELTANKNTANGYVGLGSDSKILSTYLPRATKTAEGAVAGYAPSTGNIWSMTTFGYNAGGNANTTANNNITAIGWKAGENLVSGATNNTLIGAVSGVLMTSGTNNVTIGAAAGSAITTGSRNTIIGNSNPLTNTSNDRIALGHAAAPSADGQFAIAPAITHIRANGLTAAADGTGTLLSFDSGGIIRPSAGTNKTVALIDTALSLRELTANKGQADGYASLDNTGNVPANQLGNVPAGYLPSSTKGVITTGDGTNIVDLDIGTTNNHVLTVDSSTLTGLKYAQVDHVNLANIGINTHAQIDTALSTLSTDVTSLQTKTTTTNVGSDTDTIAVIDSSGNIVQAAGTNNTVALIDTALGQRELTTNKDIADGYAGLDSDSLLDSNKLLRMYTGCSSSIWDGVTTFTQDTDVTISTDTTMTSDIICKVLTVNAATTLTTVGYGIWCEKLILNGIIANNGSNGSDGGISPGTGGLGAPAATFGGGMPGGSADSNVAQPTAAVAYYGGTFASTFIGYGGGAGSIAAGGTGTSGTSNQNNSYYIWKRNPGSNTLLDAVGRYIWAGSGGGAASGDGTNYGGSGGGGAGIVFISAKTITGTGTIQAVGGNGGNATIGNCGGGGAGSGGVIIIHTLMNPADFTISADVSGGTPGTGFGSGGTGSLSVAGIIRVFSPWTIAMP